MYLKMDQLSKLPNPVKIKRSNMGEWTRELESALMDSGLMPFFALPEDYFFVRPDPYHAGEAIRSLLSNGELPPAQRNLLDTQALRVWGQLACKQKWKGTILLRGGRGSEIVRLLDYLKGSKALCTMAWVPNEPADAAYICGLHHSVGTGIDLSFDGTTEQKKKIVAQYAAIAPLGRAIVLQ